LEVSYCSDELEQSHEAFAVDFQQGWLQPDKEATAAALLLHLSDRNLEQRYRAALAIMASQKSLQRRTKAEEAGWQDREERAQKWRAALGNQAIASRLKRVIASVSAGKSQTIASSKKQTKPRSTAEKRKKNQKEAWRKRTLKQAEQQESRQGSWKRQAGQDCWLGDRQDPPGCSLDSAAALARH
jgi:hypothetical protein